MSIRYKGLTKNLLKYISIYSISILVVFFIGLILYVSLEVNENRWDVIVGARGFILSLLATWISGVIVIWITWLISGRFGSKSVDSMTEALRDSLSAPITSMEDLINAADELLDEAGSDSVVLALLDNQVLMNDNIGARDDVVGRLADRYKDDRPTIIGFPRESGLFKEREMRHKTFWDKMTNWIEDIDNIKENFENRNSFLFPIDEVDETVLVLMEKIGKERYVVQRSIWSKLFSSENDVDMVGINNSVREDFNTDMVRYIYNSLQEPENTYSRSVIVGDDVLSGDNIIGLKTTRSIITSQILFGMNLHCKYTPNAWTGRISSTDGLTQLIDIKVIGGADGNIKYTTNQFMPPVKGGGNHSSSIIAEIFTDNDLNVEGSVWEIGCGTGYDTINMIRSGVSKVLVIDKSEDAIDITQDNVRDNTDGGLERMTSWKGDVTDCDVYAQDGKLIAKAGEKIEPWHREVEDDWSEQEVDVITMDLPLIPYFGERELTDWEKCYMEQPSETEVPPHGDDSFCCKRLPETIAKLLENWAPEVAKTDAQIILPFCAAGADEQRKVKEDVKDCVDGNLKVQDVDLNQDPDDSFIHCLRLRKNHSS